MTPLHWPDGWPWHPFLLGLPFGPQYWCWRALCRQMEARDTSCTDLWPPEQRKLGQRISAILASQLGWPSDLFIPDDPMEIVAWNHCANFVDDLSEGAAIRDIEQLASVEMI